MIDIKKLERESERDLYVGDLEKRNFSSLVIEQTIPEILDLNRKRKEAITRAEQAKAHQNRVSGEIAKKKRGGISSSSVSGSSSGGEAAPESEAESSVQELISEMGKLAEEVRVLEKTSQDYASRVEALLLTLPNYCHSSVPKGGSAKDNPVLRSWGVPRPFSFRAKDHTELGEALGIMDFERAAKVSGARFVFLKGGGARLERALIQFFMNFHSDKHGYTEMIPPYMVNEASYIGTGQFPKFREDVFSISGSDHFLISTAEVPTTNFFRDEILKEEDLPRRFCSFSPCFRSEAGSYGRDTKGLIRLHQFHKVELMVFAHPERSYEVLEEVTSHAERVLEELELPYQRTLLCTGDMGFAAAKTHDLEVWLPGSQSYREISSCTNFEDFQARRSNIRFRGGTGKPQFVHTLNGSGLAVGRTLVAILENYQQEDGTVQIPKALIPYMGGVQTLTQVK